MHKPDVLIGRFMDQPWAKQLTPKAFLNMYCLEDAPDTQQKEKPFRIPLDTGQDEIVALLARFFNQRDVHPNGIKRTMKWLLHVMNIKPSLDDLPSVIHETFEGERPTTTGAAKAILSGLRAYERYNDYEMLDILDKIAEMVKNPSLEPS